MQDPALVDTWREADAVASKAEQHLRELLTDFVAGRSAAPSLKEVLEARLLRQAADEFLAQPGEKTRA